MDYIKSLWESTIGKGIAALVGLATVVGAIVTITDVVDVMATDEELAASEARIISEVRTESAGIKLTLIEDMEARLDEFDFDISILESKGEAVPEALRIKRNMLDRRIQRLKENEINNTGSN